MYKNRMYEIRYRNNIKQKDLAEKINVASSLYSRYEKEKQIIPIKHLNTICNYFDVSIDYIFNLTNNAKYSKSRKDINKDLMAKRLKEFRKDNNLTQEKINNILKIGKGTFANYECGTYYIATPFLYTICKKYNVSADYLLGKTDFPKELDKSI